MSKIEMMEQILKKHALWLTGDPEGVMANLHGADLIEADLRGVNLYRADLIEADLIEADLRGASLIEADLIEADLRGANLHGADLRGANLRGVNLRGANLIEADLRGVNLREANLIEANLRGANLRGVNLHGVNLYRASLRDAVGNGKEIKSLQCGGYCVTFTAEVMQIGCQRHPIKDWWSLDDKSIDKMDPGTSLDWWKIWKPILESIVELK